MATLTVRNLSDEARAALRVRAARNNRSMEAEVRDILERAAREGSGFVLGWLERADKLRGDDLVLSERAPARVVDLR
jgi:plasmid stability protein